MTGGGRSPLVKSPVAFEVIVEGSTFRLRPARSVLDQASECVACNRMIAGLLGGEHSIESVKITDAGTAEAELRKSAAEVAAAIRALPEEALTRNYQMSSMTLSGEVLIDMPYRNMTYHGGQINLIQLLLGDKEFHMAPAAFK